MTPTNTHILAAEFEYLQPTSLDEVLGHLTENGAGARPIAGGTDLLVQMKIERQSPTCLISLAGVPELRTVTPEGGLAIGAAVSIRKLADSESIRRAYTALAEACDAFSTMLIKIMATLGGNLCNASPAADTAPALIVFDADAELVSRTGSRSVPVEELFVGPGETVLRAGEILRSVHLIEPAPGTGSAFLKVARVDADISQVCAAVRLVRDGDRIVDCGVSLGSVAPTPMRARRAEEHLRDQPFSGDRLEEAARIAAGETRPITDVRATEQYRRQTSRVIVRDALESAWARAGGGG